MWNLDGTFLHFFCRWMIRLQPAEHCHYFPNDDGCNMTSTMGILQKNMIDWWKYLWGNGRHKNKIKKTTEKTPAHWLPLIDICMYNIFIPVNSFVDLENDSAEMRQGLAQTEFQMMERYEILIVVWWHVVWY